MLVKVARWVRYWFGLQPLVAASSMYFICSNTWRLFQEYGPNDLLVVKGIWVGLGLVAIGGVSARAWFALRKGRPSARGWAIAASLASLPVPVFGTVAGLLGLVAFTRRDVVEKMAVQPAQERPRVPGDGTSKLLDQVATGGQILVFIVANHFWSVWAQGQGLSDTEGIFSWIVEFAIALHVSVLLHELGHVAGGWASHMKLRQLVIGPFEWSVRSGKWEFSFSAAGLWGRGAAALVPTRLKDLRGQRIFTTVGGPLGSLIAGCLGLLGALSAKGSPFENWWGCCTMLATLGFSAFVVNLIPLRPEDQYSDGAHLYQLISRGPWANVHMAFSVVSATLVTPLRARDCDVRMLDRAARFLQHGKEAMLIRLFQYLHHVDAGRIGAGVAAMAEAEALYPGLAQTLDAELHAEFVFANALFRRDLEAARLWWRRMEIKGIKRFNADYWKARAALLWVEGNREEAEEAWQKGNAVAQALPAAGAYEFDRWCFQQLREAFDETPASQVPPPLPESVERTAASTNSAQLGGGWVPLEHAGVTG
jgi:Zn-dependent protease